MEIKNQIVVLGKVSVLTLGNEKGKYHEISRPNGRWSY